MSRPMSADVDEAREALNRAAGRAGTTEYIAARDAFEAAMR